jgi:hypothetical protein
MFEMILAVGLFAPVDRPIDLTSAAVLTPANLTAPEKRAVHMLVDEVGKRSQIWWPIVNEPPQTGTPVIQIEKNNEGPAEGYRLSARPSEGASLVRISGNDSRGVLFGVGRLLRELEITRQRIVWARPRDIASAPAQRLRGHQLGYRPKTNSYDGWDLRQWEQYIRDLAVFGANAVELIPPRSDDAPDSPHFPLPQMEMMVGMSRLLDEYGLDVWIWYPALDEDYNDPAAVDFAIKEWGEVFRRLPRIDAVFVPGGDPGHSAPRVLLNLLEKQTANLHQYHPKAQMWVSPQGFSTQGLNEFCDYLQKEKPSWLSGVVHGPQVRNTVPELRRRIPERYPIRQYPDITHSLRCQYPVPDWDLAYGLTEAREPINPRPEGEAHIFRAFAKDSVGFITYSEGCNDDVNKMVWSALGWDPTQRPIDILREYGRYFIGARDGEAFAHGLLALERNWQGPLLVNSAVGITLQQFQELERNATPAERLNWRFQQALYRAYYDAFVRSRLIYETDLEDRAMTLLRGAKAEGAHEVIRRAEAVLDQAVTVPVARDLRARVFELGEALFQSIRMQLSVERYQAIDVGRGANLDTIDVPVNNRIWLKDRFHEIRQLPTEKEKLQALEGIVHWTDPGPGGYYDDLGNASAQPHLVRSPSFAEDPSFLHGSFSGFGHRPEWRRSWCTHAEGSYNTPIELEYDDLDPHASYTVKAVYAGNDFRLKVRLVANGAIEIHPYRLKDLPVKPVEFPIPLEATKGGKLRLTWNGEPGKEGSGRGCSVAEVWLIKKVAAAPVDAVPAKPR